MYMERRVQYIIHFKNTFNVAIYLAGGIINGQIIMNDADIKNSNLNYLNYVLTNTNTTGITIKREKRYTQYEK